MRFEEFVATRLPAVLRFAGVLTADRALAEDVVQEVLIRASKRWDQLDRLDHPELYVRKMILNEYLSCPPGRPPTRSRTSSTCRPPRRTSRC